MRLRQIVTSRHERQSPDGPRASRLATWSLGVFALLAFVFAVGAAPQHGSLSRSVAGQPSDAEKANTESRAIPKGAWRAPLIRSVNRLVKGFDRISGFIDANHETLNTLGTVAVAAFTFTLWQSTKALWKDGHQQAQVFRRNADLERRAWVSVDISVRTNVSIQDRGLVTASAEVNLKNVGRSPALEAVVVCDMFTGLERDFDGNISRSTSVTLNDAIERKIAFYLNPTINVALRRTILPEDQHHDLFSISGGYRNSEYVAFHAIAFVLYKTTGIDGYRVTAATQEVICRREDGATKILFNQRGLGSRAT